MLPPVNICSLPLYTQFCSVYEGASQKIDTDEKIALAPFRKHVFLPENLNSTFLCSSITRAPAAISSCIGDDNVIVPSLIEAIEFG